MSAALWRITAPPGRGMASKCSAQLAGLVALGARICSHKRTATIVRAVLTVPLAPPFPLLVALARTTLFLELTQLKTASSVTPDGSVQAQEHTS